MRATTWVAVGAVLVWACGSAVADGIGDAMVDAGRALSDATSDDAGAQDAIEVPCDIERTQVQRLETSGDEVAITYWYAEMAIDPATTSVVGSICGREVFGTVAPCPTGRTCTGDPPLPELDCTSAGATFEGTTARMHCGQRVVITSEGTPVASGQRWTTARFVAR
jgi:hypothetical protein